MGADEDRDFRTTMLRELFRLMFEELHQKAHQRNEKGDSPAEFR